jgi:5-methylcytosine-specific restriction endonuclease McrA
LLATWWKQHAILAWTITGTIVAIFVFVIIKRPELRRRLFNKAKTAVQRQIYEPTEPTAVSGRDPLPPKLREDVLKRARYRCQNPNCRKHVALKIHHIDGNRNNNVLSNLIALCGTCHDKADYGEYPEHQLRVWLLRSRGQRSEEKSERRRRRFQA